MFYVIDNNITEQDKVKLLVNSELAAAIFKWVLKQV